MSKEAGQYSDADCHCKGLQHALTDLQAFDIVSAVLEWEFIWAPLLFTALALFTRMYKIGLSPIVTWDEAQ